MAIPAIAIAAEVVTGTITLVQTGATAYTLIEVVDSFSPLIRQAFNLDGRQKPVSAFVIAELALAKTLQAREEAMSVVAKTKLEKLKKIAKVAGISMFGGMIAMPLMVALTPLTIITDIAVGIIGSIYMAYKGEERDIILQFAFRKIIFFPTQQLAIATLGLIVIKLSGIFFPLMMLWPLAYKAGVKLSDYLSSFDPEGSNASIFTRLKKETLEKTVGTEMTSALDWNEQENEIAGDRT